ncbi:MAG TPA: response regulator [Planctomycetota bacterium]|jgi:CheY-like chemotaxis protein|nr:response regulator [Planctomycetota bacterium]
MESSKSTLEEAVSQERQVVICIDDDAPVLSAIRRLLRHEPYEVITTLDPAEVIRLVGSREVNLIIADQRMPQMLGTELLKTVRQRSPETICVILTGHADLSDIAGAMNEGAVDRLIRKPWDDADFRKMIRDLLDRRGPGELQGEDVPPPPAERVQRRLQCGGRRPEDVLREISETLEGPDGPPPRVVFTFDNLMGLLGSLNMLLSDAVNMIVTRGARAALVDGSGTAGTFLELVGGRLPVVVYRSMDEMGPPKRVLVVEAKSDNLEFLRALIESAGHECDAVSSVGEAIQRLSATPYDLVLLDLVLHDAEGIEVARHILERGLTTPVIAISGLLDRASGAPDPRGSAAPRAYSAREILDAIRNS